MIEGGETREAILNALTTLAERAYREDSTKENVSDPFHECEETMQKALVSDITRRIEGKPALFFLIIDVESVSYSGLEALDMRRKWGMSDATIVSLTGFETKRIPVPETFARRFAKYGYDKNDRAKIKINGGLALEMKLVIPKSVDTVQLSYTSVLIDEDIARKYAEEVWTKEMQIA